jgi:beta-glucanase (GH16 family)
VLGWGKPLRADGFDGTALGDAWNVYDGPGHAGNGRRTPRAVSVRGGLLTIKGDARGNTAGMEWSRGRRYGRWEGRVKAPASDETYNALLLLWPDAENFPVGGEVDFMEMMDHTRQETNVFLHYGKKNRQVSGSVRIDATQWHNWAVEWTPTHIATFVDGKQWWRTDRKDVLPPGPMHLCIQLDWFPHDGRGKVTPSTMQVDWVKEYALSPKDLGKADAGEAAAGPRPGGTTGAARRGQSGAPGLVTEG